MWECFWGEYEHTPQKWAPFCPSLSARKMSASAPADPTPISTPAPPPVFSGSQLQDLVLKGQRQQQQDWTKRARAADAMGEGLVGLKPSPVEGSPTDNSWTEPWPAELSWKEVAEWLAKRQWPAGPAQWGGRNSSTDTCTELSPAKQWCSLTQGTYLSLAFVVSGWQVWEMLAMEVPLPSCLCSWWPRGHWVGMVSILPLSGKPSVHDLQGESTICLFLPNGEHLFAG